MSDYSASPSDHNLDLRPLKRKSIHLDGTSAGRSVKRRASKACQSCRARKVRCNVTEHGAPCTNCRLDEVECIVSESRRKKKWSKDDEHLAENSSSSCNINRKLASRDALDGAQNLSIVSPTEFDNVLHHSKHVPHSIYQSHGNRNNSAGSYAGLPRRFSITSQINGIPTTMPFTLFGTNSRAPFFSNPSTQPLSSELPRFLKPLPAKIGPEEIAYLQNKGALTVPSGDMRSEMLRAYIEFVHPYMPLLDLEDFLTAIDREDGSQGRVSLILFQAVMFAGSAFIDMQYLSSAGYSTRKEARKDFFQKTRILYDFDSESDRVSLVQALLLLTYYYETPDDQKDTWHWMGVATSVAHTIGLHRNPANTHLDPKRIKLWKRIWWSTYMRDRLIALGMRRPTRIKTEDFDVPMLTLDDFEIAPLSESITCIPADCRVARNVDVQRQLAVMCIEKARLCLCISHVLSKQYCVLNNNCILQNDRTTMMLLPKKLAETSEVKACDEELQNWVNELPEEAQYVERLTGEATIDLARSVLHMVFFATLSALHRPQVLPSSQGGPDSIVAKIDLDSNLLDVSRRNVRRAASAITSIAQRLDADNLVKYLPTSGVTVLLPAIIIHLLDIKAPEEETRHSSRRGFCQCMAVMGKLRDIYAAADYSVAFLEAATRKAGIQVPNFSTHSSPINKASPVITVDELIGAGRRMGMGMSSSTQALQRSTLTPPPDAGTTSMSFLEKQPGEPNVSDAEVARRLETFLASTPPESDHEVHTSITISQDTPMASVTSNNMIMAKWSTMDFPTYPFTLGSNACPATDAAINHHSDDELLFSSLPLRTEVEDGDFDQLLNLDAVGETFSFDDGGVVDTSHGANAAGTGMGLMSGINGLGEDVNWWVGGDVTLSMGV